jgi:phosphate-selective porin OprO/OprP
VACLLASLPASGQDGPESPPDTLIYAASPDEPAPVAQPDAPLTPQEVEQLRRMQAEWKESKRLEEKESSTPTFKIGGQIVIDALWFSQDANSRAAVGDIEDAFDFRRARLYGQGEAFEVFNYAMGFDFAQGSATNGRPVFLDNYVGVKDLPVLNNLRVGHFFEPFSLERSSSNRNTTFIERSLADAFAPARNLGIMAFNESEDRRYYYAFGTFHGGSDNFGDDEGDQEGGTADVRLAYRPWYDEDSRGRSMLHLGAAYSFRNASDGEVRFRSRPEAFGHSDSEAIATPFFTDTGDLPAHYSQLFGTEMLLVLGSFSVQGEYIFASVNRTTGDDAVFQGGYLYCSYFLTGEHRTYNRAGAIVDRVQPLENFFRVRTGDGPIVTGSGAWEVALRLSQINLTNLDVLGGRLTDLTAGLNWYLTPYQRVKFDYILAHLEKGVTSNTSIFGLRFDSDF